MMTPRQKTAPTCQSCPLLAAGSDFSQPEGVARYGVALIGEASGENEQRDQLPFRPYASAGSMLTRVLSRVQLPRDNFAITNVCRCRPWGNQLDGASYEIPALAACEPNLIDFLRQFRPRVLVALGNVALRALTGWRGEKRTVSHVRGYVLPALAHLSEAARGSAERPLLVIPTYHPAFLRRGATHLMGVLARDIARAVNVAAGRDTSYILDLPDLVSYHYEDTWGTPEEEAAEQEKSAKARASLAAWLQRNSLRYNLHPTVHDLDAFCRDVRARSDAWQALTLDAREASHLALSWDLETVESASLDEDATDGFTDTVIRMAQFSIEPGQAIVLNWDGVHPQAVRWLLKLPLPKVGQNNWLFDDRVVEAVGARDFGQRDYFLPAGPNHDALQQFHYANPDLPAHLQFAASFCQFPFPWKHLNGDAIEFYGAVDPDAALRSYLSTRRTLESRGIWWDSDRQRSATGYVAMVEQVRPILADMERRGLPINDERRLALGAEFDGAERELKEELDRLFPDEARKIKSYKTIPPEVTALLERLRAPALPPADAMNEKGKPLPKTTRARMEREARLARYAALDTTDLEALRTTTFWEVTAKDRTQAEERAKEREKLAAISTAGTADDLDEEISDEDDVDEATGQIGKAYRYGLRAVGEGEFARPTWCRIYAFSPNSAPQMYAYMKAKRHPIPFDRKLGRNTTAKRELLRLGDKFHDPFYAKVIECREVRKMRTTYIDGFRPHADGRAHPTFTFATATGQLSARNPNSQNYPSRARLAKAIKGMIEAPEGYELANWDKKSYHVVVTGFLAEDPDYIRLARMDMHSFVAWHFLKLPDAGRLISLPDEELAERLQWFKSNKDHPEYKRTRDNQAKPCIAEGELVLTDRGLIPIQNVTLAHRVWDGVEWVQHAGVIYQGVKEVITYDGLTATKCHRVVTRDGNTVSFAEAASGLARLETTGIGGTPVRTAHRDQLEDAARREVLARKSEMHGMWNQEDDRTVQHASGKDSRVPVLQSDEIAASDSSRSEIRRDYLSVLLSAQSQVPPVRWAGDQVPVPVSERIRSICSEEFAARFVPWFGDRSHRQRRELRAGEFALGYPQGADSESSKHHVDSNGDGSGTAPRVGESLRRPLDGSVSASGNDRDGYYSPRTGTCPEGKVEVMETAPRVARFARVYDIVDAGPRRCYTVSGKLVHNCILGIALGLMPNHLYEMNREHFDSVAHTKRFHDMIKGLFPRVFQWQQRVCAEAHQRAMLDSRFGMIRQFYEVFAPDRKGGMRPGDQYNAAMAFRVQNEAHGELREMFKALRRAGLDEKYGLVNTIHDSITLCYRKELRDEMVREVHPILEMPSKVLVHPKLAPQGLVVGVECTVGKNMADLVEVKLG